MSSAVEQQVPEGFKQTEVGIVPIDWKVFEIQAFSKTSSGTTPARAQEDRYYKGGEIYWVKTTDLNNSVVKITEDKVTELALKETSLQTYPVGTVLVAMYGGFNQIGRTGILSVAAAVNQALVAIQANKNIDSRYLLYMFNYKVEYWKSVASSSRKDPNITSLDVKRFKLALPPTKNEQTAIANALFDVDALVISLEKLIAKKRAIKTATMQQLLTGKKRLPPFDKTHTGYKQTELGEIPEDWEVRAVGSALSIRHGRDQKQIERQDGTYPILGTGGEMGRTDTFIYDKPSVLIGRKGTINKPVYMESPFWTVDTLFYSSVDKKYSAKFIYYKFCMIDWMSYNEASGVPSLNASTIESVIQTFPADKKEQAAIADVLTDIDKEIEALEQRLNKTQQLKKGMMQELLTGRTRLV